LGRRGREDLLGRKANKARGVLMDRRDPVAPQVVQDKQVSKVPVE